MERKIIVVTAAYGHEYIAAMGGQQAVLPTIAAGGADGVEIRRELFTGDELQRLPALGDAIAAHGLMACYSAPETLFDDIGALNNRIPALLQEARQLKAHWLKLSLGHFHSDLSFSRLTDWLDSAGVALVVENDQTSGGRQAPMQRFQAACQVQKLPVSLTFDMANWLWLGESPEDAARYLAPAVSYIHVKAAVPHQDSWRAVPPDSDDPRWLALLQQLPDDVPRGIEFPLQGDDLVAVTRRYVQLLRET
ncbi:sugar phosphate isomerase/epimerase family protein [Entomohabitans teleogrylli]|uniref:sugar phosphate isomerase/epimerase family protein n=1 Tax=Entomohabitans teleogrylli TaxID=1384589 RepID=UPI00073D73B6|nr:xylose isomerase [Entomohabitans teleogrylli]